MTGRSPKRRRGKAERPIAEPAPHVITKQAELAEACAQLSEESSFAFDTEFVMEDRFTPEVCVVQLATFDDVFIVDPYEVEDLSPVWKLVADPEIETIVHAGAEDLSLCQTQGGVTPQNVFDCQVACGLVTTHYPLSLARLVGHFVGVRLRKSQTLTDWRRRPLSDEQIRYAANDVVHLPAAHRELKRKLAAMNREGWLAEEMERFTRKEAYERSVVENTRRLKGAGSLDSMGLAIAAELVKVREELASRFDRPPRAVVRDHLIVEIARHRWTKADDIRRLRGLNLRTQAVQSLADAVVRASNIPEQDRPTPTPTDDESEEEAAIAMLIGAVVRAYAAEHQVAHQLLATKKDVRSFVRRHLDPSEPVSAPALERGWRSESVGAAVRDLLAGRVRLGIESHNGTLGVVFR